MPDAKSRPAALNVVQLRPAPRAPLSPYGMDVEGALLELLRVTRGGGIVGLAFAVKLHSDKQCYVSNVAGSCAEELTHTLGMLAGLSSAVANMLSDRDPNDRR